jgi:hypothetical protein
VAKKASDYVSFHWGILALILLAALGRLTASLAGAPPSQARWLSATAMLLAGAVWAGWRVQRAGFGAFKELYLLLLVQGLAAHPVASLGIAIGVLTGTDNVYTVPEFASPFGARTWGHALGHLVLIPIGTVPLWLLGSLALLVSRKVARA